MDSLVFLLNYFFCFRERFLIIILVTQKKKISAQYKRKPDHCYYCENSVLNFGRHVIRSHSTEIDVIKILAKPINSRERKQLFNALRRKGNFLADSINCFRPVRKGYVQGREKLPCDNCIGYFSAPLLHRHRKRCIDINQYHFNKKTMRYFPILK